MERRNRHNRPWWNAMGRRGPAVTVVGLLALVTAGCGQGQQPGLGADVVGSTTLTIPTTTTPTATTTTIDFNRPVFQGVAPLAEEAGLDDVVALVVDLRGQTNDVTEQITRLAPFLDIDAAVVAQITGIDIVLAPEDENRHPGSATVWFRTPVAGPDVVLAIDNEFQSLGWFTNDVSRSETDGDTITESVFRNPGFDPDELEFRSSVVSGQGTTTVELTYVVAADDEEATADDGSTYFERLSAWQDELSLPGAAELTEVGVEADDEAGAVFARYLLTADDETEAIALLVRSIASGDYQLLGATADDPPTAGPLRLVDPDGTLVVVELAPSPADETFLIEARHGFVLDPLD